MTYKERLKELGFISQKKPNPRLKDIAVFQHANENVHQLCLKKDKNKQD